MAGTRFTLEVRPNIPQRIGRLTELANDLLYSWDRQVRRLFYLLDHELWEACRHNPKVFLRRVAQQRLDAATRDRGFMEDYNRVISTYDTYHKEGMRTGIEDMLDPEQDLVAYFCAEFGFHESFPIYSGGLGILAGDHCKAASDLGIPFVAVGLLYRKGYFTQTIDGHGNQLAHSNLLEFQDLPIQPAIGLDGSELHVDVQFPGRQVDLKVWQAKAGHITLYLLDSDLASNSEHDRAITYQLYGGDKGTRIQQEIVLGIGGVRALRALGRQPTVWHINEGHAAFLILERCREAVAQGMDFETALELIAAGTVFTTHTPVPAGHDIFELELFRTYFHDFAAQLDTTENKLLALGSSPVNPEGFNMTALALRGSRFHNGVSRIHGRVASNMESYVWPQIAPQENPIAHVTNGVHLPTFLAREWLSLFYMRFSDWQNGLLDNAYWECLDDIPDLRFWSLRQELKTAMMRYVRTRATEQHRRNGLNATTIARITRYLSDTHADTLVLGFARRFATYKRATLLFSDPQRLARLLNDLERPVVLIFAGKAHPHDEPGQQLIRDIHDYSMRPEFLGKIILIEGYDMALGRSLVTGVDVWINTPEYPLEASGTSGQKAGINGVINLSVLDGWWGEGYSGDNGWAIAPHGPQFDRMDRDREESRDLLDIVEHEVIPLYYDRDHQGYSPAWVQFSKASMKSIIPRFNAQRMVRDYVRDFYNLAKEQHRQLATADGAAAHELARWKRKVRELWPGVSMKLLTEVTSRLKHGEILPIRVAAFLNGLSHKDVVLECQVGKENADGEFEVLSRHFLEPEQPTHGEQTIFSLAFEPKLAGLQSFKIRMYPYHDHLSHTFEMGFMIWL